MKRLLSLITPTTIIITILWSAASWALQSYLGIPSWCSVLTNLFFIASVCLKYPAQGAQRTVTLRNDWIFLAPGTLTTLFLLRWIKNVLQMPTWGYYIALVFSIIILERIIIELKKAASHWAP